jgi:hypothetical protein
MANCGMDADNERIFVRQLRGFECRLPAHRDISLHRRIWSLSGPSGLRQAVRPADLWVHGLIRASLDLYRAVVET